MIGQDRNTPEDIKPQKNLMPGLFQEDLRDDCQVFAWPGMFQMQSTILLKDIPEHVNVIGIGFDCYS
jgi:hypothetical protein